VSKGADVNFANNIGETPLHAAIWGSEEVAKVKSLSIFCFASFETELDIS
jgi:hypothetical protein